MPTWTTPWRTTGGPPDPATGCTVLAGRLSLRSYRDFPRLLWWALRIRRRLVRFPGLVGHAFGADPRDGTLWIVSAWADRAELARFDRTGPHHEAKRRLRPALLTSTLAVWRCRPDELPVPWSEVRRRIAQADRRGGLPSASAGARAWTTKPPPAR